MRLQIGPYREGWWGHQLITVGPRWNLKLLFMSYYSRSKAMIQNIASAVVCGTTLRSDYDSIVTKKEEYVKIQPEAIKLGYDRMYLGTMINKEIGKKYLLTTQEFFKEDFYNLLMENFDVELLPEWTEEISKHLMSVRAVSTTNFRKAGDDNSIIYLHGKSVRLAEVIVIDCSLVTEERLEQAVIKLLELGKIKISDKLSKKLEIPDLNAYVTAYGHAGVEKIAEKINPLVPEERDGVLETVALNTKSLTPMQIRCVNGIAELMKRKKGFALAVEGMGCGKTAQAMAAVLANENRKAMVHNGDKTLKEMYQNGHQPRFRTIVMCPPHLCEMWAREWKKEVPYSEAHIIKGLPDLERIKEAGRPRAAELYVISKETAKADSQKAPVPTRVKKQYIKAPICKTCYEADGKKHFKPLGDDAVCPDCGGREWTLIELKEYGEHNGLICPDCGNLLINNRVNIEKPSDESKIVLTPLDFTAHTMSNDRCYCCGSHLWAASVKNLGAGISGEASKPKRWKKISHWKNYQHRSKSTAFVLKGHEAEYLNGIDKEGMTEISTEGPRKASLSQYIKKHLHGVFDYCILDEAHKYEGAGTAQSVAAQALVRASKFTLALTGTISNGKASSLFYLLFMLCPRKMVSKGYTYGDMMKFSSDYGCVEQLYEGGGGDGEEYNSNSRGRKIGSPRIKPGISPLLQLDFLTGHSVFLDLSDMADILQPLNEYVVPVEMPVDVRSGYTLLMDDMKTRIRMKGGRSYLSSFLQTCLAYPSKPWGIPPIMSTTEKGQVICQPQNFSEYMSLDTLLPKETAFIEKVQEEIEEGRNIFVYCSFTGDESKDCTERLKALVEKYCNLKGQVLIMRAGTPSAEKREEFIHKKAAEGYKVVICNQKLVETGLDFCFTYEGVNYNYPTIMVYQLTYELAVQMQSTRRHYRLNQTRECRTYYFVTEGTTEMAALTLMADKQVAAAALQGNFSTEGLSAMASGVDDKVKLVQMMQAGDNGDTSASIKSKFEKLNAARPKSVYDLFNRPDKPPTFPELMGYTATTEVEMGEVELPATTTKVVTKPVRTVTATATTTATMLDDTFNFFGFDFGEASTASKKTKVVKKVAKKETKTETAEATKVVSKPSSAVTISASKKPTSKEVKEGRVEGQVDIFALLAA